MIKYIQFMLLLGSYTIAFPSFANEIGFPTLTPPTSSKKITATGYFPGKLKASQFVSNLNSAANSWRSKLDDKGNSLNVNLKLGEWERSNSKMVDTIWLANRINWSNIQNNKKDIEFSYTFSSCSSGILSTFKLSNSLDSVGSDKGGYSLSLNYGKNTVTFRSDSDSTTGELPFKITEGTTVRIRIKSEKSADIWIDNQPILADQAVNLRNHFISIIAKTDSPEVPQVFRLSSLTAKLVRPE